MLPMPDRQTTEYRATQLVYSIKFKLSHAMSFPGQLKRQEVMFNNYSDTNHLYLNSQFAAKF